MEYFLFLLQIYLTISEKILKFEHGARNEDFGNILLGISPWRPFPLFFSICLFYSGMFLMGKLPVLLPFYFLTHPCLFFLWVSMHNCEPTHPLSTIPTPPVSLSPLPQVQVFSFKQFNNSIVVLGTSSIQKMALETATETQQQSKKQQFCSSLHLHSSLDYFSCKIRGRLFLKSVVMSRKGA